MIWIRRTSSGRFIRGGDYQKEKYKPRSVVVDNPPFSILAQIIKWYTDQGIRFFLFAPALVVFSSAAAAAAAVLCVGASITYANKATVSTSFVTNLEPENIRARTEPSLFKRIETAMDEVLAETRNSMPVYSYPDEVATAAMLNKYSKYGIDFKVIKEESVPIEALDSQKEVGKAIFGKGLLLSERAAAERAAAERAAAERAAAERAAAERAAAERAAAERAAATRWELSPRERGIIKNLGE